MSNPLPPLYGEPQDPGDLYKGFDCVCAVCGKVYHDWIPSNVCGRCDYLNGLEEFEDDR